MDQHKITKDDLMRLYKGCNAIRSLYTITKNQDTDEPWQNDENNNIINYNEKRYMITKEERGDHTKTYIRMLRQNYNKNKYLYATTNSVLPPYCGRNYSYALNRSGDIGWVSGIIVSKKDSIHINKIEISIGGHAVCTIDAQLLLILFGYELDDYLIYIPIPKTFIFINSSSFSGMTNPLDLDVNHMHGIPLFHLIYNEVRVNISADQQIEPTVVLEYTHSTYLKISRRIASSTSYQEVLNFNIDENDHRSCTAKIQQLHFEELKDIPNVVRLEFLSLGLTSYTSFKCKSHSDLDLIMKNIIFHKTELLKIKESFSVTKMSMRRFRSIIYSIPMDTFVGGSYVLAMYQATLIDPLTFVLNKMLPICLLEIIIEYVPFDPNHAIIIYEENCDDIQCYRVDHQMLYFNKGELCREYNQLP